MEGDRILEAIKLLQQERGVRIPRWAKLTRLAIVITGIALVWIVSIWMIIWLRNVA